MSDKQYTERDVRNIISMVCDHFNMAFVGREEFLDLTIVTYEPARSQPPAMKEIDATPLETNTDRNSQPALTNQQWPTNDQMRVMNKTSARLFQRDPPPAVNGAQWVKASEYKVKDRSEYRPYRKKSEHAGCDYDFGEIYITVDGDGVFLDVENENKYKAQNHFDWEDYEILDESPTAATHTIDIDDVLSNPPLGHEKIPFDPAILKQMDGHEERAEKSWADIQKRLVEPSAVNGAVWVKA